MKKSFIVLGLALAFAACNGNKSTNSSDSTTTTTTTSTTSASSSTTAVSDTAGKALIAQNDCLTCHKLDQKIVGPAYQDVANKYTASPAVIDTLADKVIKGGSGNWGSVPMSAHPTLAMGDAREMVKYILSLKK
jgi:cytochrome c